MIIQLTELEAGVLRGTLSRSSKEISYKLEQDNISSDNFTRLNNNWKALQQIIHKLDKCNFDYKEVNQIEIGDQHTILTVGFLDMLISIIGSAEKTTDEQNIYADTAKILMKKLA